MNKTRRRKQRYRRRKLYFFELLSLDALTGKEMRYDEETALELNEWIANTMRRLELWRREKKSATGRART